MSLYRRLSSQPDSTFWEPELLPQLANSVASVIRDIQFDGKLRGGLGRVSLSVVKELGFVVEMLDTCHGVDFVEAMDDETWYKLADLHSDVLAELDVSEGYRAQRLEEMLSNILCLFLRSNVLKAKEAFGRKLAYILIQQHTFQRYARLFAAWRDVPPNALESKLRLMAQFTGIFGSCATLMVSDQPLQPTDTTGTALYAAWLEELASSHLLEHISKALLQGMEAAHVAVKNGRLPMDQYCDIRLGIIETCGCITSALYGITGKQAKLDARWPSTGASDPLDPRLGLTERLLLRARAVLSGPCLQFLLAREVIASRLRLRGGNGPTFGLPDGMLPEFYGTEVDPPTSRVLTDCLLSRLATAALVFHLIIPWHSRQGPGPAATQQAMLPPLPYRSVNLFDMIMEALSAVADPNVPVEHAPGGSQLTLLEPAMLLVKLTPRMHPRHLRPRLRNLWQILVTIMRRPQVKFQYTEHGPLQNIGGLLVLHMDVGDRTQARCTGETTAVAAPNEGDNGADGAAANDCAVSLRCAIEAGFVPAVEQLLRGWCRSSDPSTEAEILCLRAINHLLHWQCVWPALLAHGSVREMASLIVTLRRLGEQFKDRGFALMSKSVTNGPKVHQCAEKFITAYMAALLEQQAMVLLGPWRDGAGGDSSLALTFALNCTMKHAGMPVMPEAINQMGGRPTAGTPAGVQQRALSVFTLTQWLPNAVWLVHIMDPLYQANMGRAVLRWVLQAALQCLAAKGIGLGEQKGLEMGRPPSSAAAAGPTAADPTSASCSEEASSSHRAHSEGSSTSTTVEQDSTCISSEGEAITTGQRGPDTAPAYEAWGSFLMVNVGMQSWIKKFFDQLRLLEGTEKAGAVSKKESTGTGTRRRAGKGGLPATGREDDEVEKEEQEEGSFTEHGPEVLSPYVLDVLEVLVLAMEHSAQECIVRTEAYPGRAPVTEGPTTVGGAADRSDDSFPGAEMAGLPQPASPSSLAYTVDLTAAATSKAAAEDNVAVGALEVISAPEAGLVTKAAPPAASSAEASTSDADTRPPSKPKLELNIVMDDWFRTLLRSHGRDTLLCVLDILAEAKSSSAGQQPSPPRVKQGTSLEERMAPQLRELRKLVWEKHDVSNLPDLPSPHGAAATVEAAGIKLCMNPTCMNLGEDSEAALSGRKICPRCKVASYCSGDCQWKHWKSKHSFECQGIAIGRRVRSPDAFGALAEGIRQ